MRIIVLLIIFTSALTATMPKPLEDIVSFALKNSPEYRRILLTHRTSLLSLKTSYHDLLPNVSLATRSGSGLSETGEYLQLTYEQLLTDGINLDMTMTDYFNNDADPRKDITLTTDLDSFYTNFRKKLFRIAHKQQMLSFEKSTEDFKIRVINKAYELVRQKSRVSVLKETLGHWENTFKYYQAKYQIGNISKISLLNAEINYLEQENRVNYEEKNLSDSMDEFRIMIGYSLDDSLEINTSVEKEDFDWKKIPMLEAYGERQKKLQLEKAQIEYRQAGHNKFGSLQLTSNFYNDIWDRTTDTYSNYYQGTLTYSFSFGKNNPRYELQKESWALDSTRIGMELQELESERARREIISRYNYLKRNLELSEKKLSSAREQHEYAQIAIQKGLISTLDMQDAQTKLTDAQLDLLNATINFIRLKYEMIVTFGGKI